MVDHEFLLEKIVPYWMYFGQGENWPSTELSEKEQYIHNPAVIHNKQYTAL